MSHGNFTTISLDELTRKREETHIYEVKITVRHDSRIHRDLIKDEIEKRLWQTIDIGYTESRMLPEIGDHYTEEALLRFLSERQRRRDHAKLDAEKIDEEWKEHDDYFKIKELATKLGRQYSVADDNGPDENHSEAMLNIMSSRFAESLIKWHNELKAKWDVRGVQTMNSIGILDDEKPDIFADL